MSSAATITSTTPRARSTSCARSAAPSPFTRISTVLGEDGTKLSKRHGAVSVMEYAAEGFLAEAMVNGLARIGWAHGDAEVFSREELVAWFGLAAINPASSRFDAAKLRWLNQEHMKRLPAADLGARLQPFLERAGLDVAAGPSPAEVAVLLRERVETLVEMADAAHYFYAPPPVHLPEKLAASVTAAVRPALVELDEVFRGLEWTRESIAAAIKTVAGRHGLKPPQVMMALRALVAGEPQTPAIDAVVALVGRERVRERLVRGIR